MPLPVPFVATYRLQLRQGIDLERARDLLPWLKRLGISHLYLAPPFHAASGSTHGYDVIDPTCIDPALGGNEGFIRLSEAAQAAGIGIVIDIVPNHMAFTPENPWLADVLRHGRNSKHAQIFDIDWDRGRLHFPVLDGQPEDLLDQGQIGFAGDGSDPRLKVYEREYPLRAGNLAQAIAQGSRTLDGSTLLALLDEQHWSLGHWQHSADAIVHRRFFNITDLIGVRQEDSEVFELTHRWIIAHVKAGHIQGLRVDHIDGLSQPGGYLHRLREAVGNSPVWVEKILKDGETIPASWPIEGMSGYEFMTPVTRLLLDAEGLNAMRSTARGAVPADYGQEVRAVRRRLLEQTFAPEMRRVTSSALAALAMNAEAEGEVAEAIAQLATEWPVYRSYAADRDAFSTLVAKRLDTLDQSGQVANVIALLRATDDPLACAFTARFEQLTGALTAKSEEDTVFFRSVAALPLCEVGSEPDLGGIDTRAFQRAMEKRVRQTPLALNALSTHDTKRSADARAILIALSRFPESAQSLYQMAREEARSSGVPEGWGIYALQTALIMQDEDDATKRIADHIAKAMREGKELSQHEAPNTEAEEKVAALCSKLRDRLIDNGIGDDDDVFEATVNEIVLTQVFLQMTAPGIPDMYQGSEGLAVSLTDPDNRRPVDWDGLASGHVKARSKRKLDLTTRLLERRRADPDLFAQGTYVLGRIGKAWQVERSLQDRRIVLEFVIDNDQPRLTVHSRQPDLQTDGL